MFDVRCSMFDVECSIIYYSPIRGVRVIRMLKVTPQFIAGARRAVGLSIT